MRVEIVEMDGGDQVVDAAGPAIAVVPSSPSRAFEAVFRADHRSIVALTWALTGDRAVAEEVTQEAFLRAHQRWDRIGGYDNPGAWVRRTAINLALSDRRRRGAERRALERVGPPAESSDDGAGAVASADRFWRAVRALPRRQAAVIALHYVEDRSVAEIATVLEIAEGTVKAHLHQARAALSASFAPEEER